MRFVGVHQVAAAFDGAASEYERARPSYPPEAVAHLVDTLALAHGAIVADVGAGTGKLTRLLTASGATVLGVEPLEGMRATLASTVVGARAIGATAEHLPLPDGSVDAITVAQAVHWFGPGAALELARVTRPGGAIAVVYNVRDYSQDLHRVMSELREQVAGSAPNYRSGFWRAAFDACAELDGPQTTGFQWAAYFDHATVLEQFRSLAPIAALAAADRDERAATVAALLACEDDPVELRYTTEVHVWRRR